MNFSVTRSMLRLVDSDYQLDLNNCQHLNANNSYFTFLFIYSTKVSAAFCYTSPYAKLSIIKIITRTKICFQFGLLALLLWCI